MCEYCQNQKNTVSFTDFISSLLSEEPTEPAYGQPSSYSSFFEQFVKPQKEQAEATSEPTPPTTELSEAGRDVLGYIRCMNALAEPMSVTTLSHLGGKVGITDTDKILLAKAQLADFRKKYTGQPGGSIVNWFVDLLAGALT